MQLYLLNFTNLTKFVYKFLFNIIAIILIALTIIGCQTTPKTTSNFAKPTINKQFNITGKIGITTPEQTNSAFYSWAQENERFAIDLSGALGIGQTIIEYNGKTATLMSEKTGSITADNPEELLFKATGWQAPISQLPNWILGKSVVNDNVLAKDKQQRITEVMNGDSGWQAQFNYLGNQHLPNKIIMRHQAGYRVILTINYLNSNN